jgi:hypothetical protein
VFTVERRVGRLVEARVFRLMAVADVEQYGRAFPRHLLNGHPILLADHRPVVIYPQDVVDRLIEMFRGLNRSWERAAIMISSTNATLQLQLQRVVREAHNPSRRVFTDSREACRFLSETLTPEELARADAFLDEAPPSGPPPMSQRGGPPSSPPLSGRGSRI